MVGPLTIVRVVKEASMHSLLRVTSVLGFASLLVVSASAGANRWTITGPPAEITAMAIDPHNPDILHAAGWELMARSQDRGATWSLLTVPNLHEPTAVRVSQSISSTIYVLGYGALFRSTNGGISWDERKVPATVQIQNDVQVDATNANSIVVACSNFCFFGCSGGGVFRSEDGGNSWKAMGLKDINVYEITLDPSTSQIVYALTENSLLRTANRGSSWSEITPPSGEKIRTLAVDQITRTTLYAFAEGGVYRSPNSGQSWELIRPAPYGGSIATATDGSHQICVSAGGVGLTVDGGETWKELGTSNSGLQFNGLSSLAVSRDVCYMISDLIGQRGQILSYEIPQPRRRAVRN
jgi:photosystem II stability/assembly factor-like uncharacterized protein